MMYQRSTRYSGAQNLSGDAAEFDSDDEKTEQETQARTENSRINGGEES
jgi:hypothetical protein